MSSVQVLGLSPSELATALAYELEPASGISAANAEVEYRPMADPDESVRVFEVAVRASNGKAKSGDPFSRYVVPAIIFGAVLLGLVVADFCYLKSSQSSALRERSVRAPLDAQVKAAENDARAKRAEASRIRAAREAAILAQDAAAALRSSEADALRAIASACGSSAALTSVAAPEELVLEVSGTAVSAGAAADVMAALTEKASLVGWRFRPDTIKTHDSRMLAVFTGRLEHD